MKQRKRRKRLYIGIAGAGTCSESIYKMAKQVGFRLAQEGLTIVCGARGGVMEAAARGAKEGGGISIGILPG